MRHDRNMCVCVLSRKKNSKSLDYTSLRTRFDYSISLILAISKAISKIYEFSSGAY